jgi:hypothetical protein
VEALTRFGRHFDAPQSEHRRRHRSVEGPISGSREGRPRHTARRPREVRDEDQTAASSRPDLQTAGSGELADLNRRCRSINLTSRKGVRQVSPNDHRALVLRRTARNGGSSLARAPRGAPFRRVSRRAGKKGMSGPSRFHVRPPRSTARRYARSARASCATCRSGSVNS